MLTADGHLALRGIILSPDEAAGPRADHPRSPYRKARSTRRGVSAVIPHHAAADRAPQADDEDIALRTRPRIEAVVDFPAYERLYRVPRLYEHTVQDLREFRVVAPMSRSRS
jgi:hypothetical protein